MREHFAFKWFCYCEKKLNEIGTHIQPIKLDEISNGFDEVEENLEDIVKFGLYDDEGQNIYFDMEANCININDGIVKVLIDNENYIVHPLTKVSAPKKAVSYIQTNENGIVMYSVGIEKNNFGINIQIDMVEGVLNISLSSKDDNTHEFVIIEDGDVMGSGQFNKSINLTFDPVTD